MDKSQDRTICGFLEKLSWNEKQSSGKQTIQISDERMIKIQTKTNQE